jgi:O-antigen biosynthesis protein WbqP
MKRVFDLVLCCFMIPIAIPVCLVAAVAILLECKASPFFWQVRLGRHETPFRLLKLRTMAVDTIQAASHEVNQQQILKVGRIMRATKVDEMPQLWNVLIGDMSLVGPRPGLPLQQELTAARRQFNVFELLPGITGISQIAGMDMSSPWDLAMLDASYNQSWRVDRDLSILLRTVLGSGSGDAATRNGKRG